MVDHGPRAGGTPKQGLVSLPEELQQGLVGRFVAGLILLASLVLVLGTTAIDLLYAKPRPKLLGKEKVLDDRRRAAALSLEGILSGRWARHVEHEYRVRSRIRSYTGKRYGAALFTYLRETGPGVVLGEGSWIFLSNRIHPPAGPRRLTAGAPAAVVAAIDRRLHSLGIEHYVLPLPRKAALYADKLPRHIDPDLAYDLVFLDVLRERGVDPIDLWAPYREYRQEEEEPLYRPYDSHWSPLAEKIAAEEAARHMGLLVPESERRTRLEFAGRRHRGGNPDIMKMLDLSFGEEALDRLRGEPASYFELVANDAVTVAPPVERDVALCGTSFSARRSLPTYLGHYVDSAVENCAIHASTFQQSLREMLLERGRHNRPQVVIQELPLHQTFGIAERQHLDGAVPDLFFQNPPQKTLPLLSGERFMQASHAGGGPEGQPSQAQVLMIPPGILAHSGAGAVSLRLRAKHPDRPGVLRVRTGDFLSVLRWTPGTQEVVFPVLHSRIGSPLVRIQAEARGGEPFVLEAFDVVGEYTDVGAVPCDVGPLTRLADTGETWEQILELPPGTPFPRYGAIVIQSTQHPLGGRAVATVECAGGASRVFVFRGLKPGAMILLDPGKLAGATVERVRFRGNGKPPVDFVESARLVQPLGAGR